MKAKLLLRMHSPLNFSWDFGQKIDNKNTYLLCTWEGEDNFCEELAKKLDIFERITILTNEQIKILKQSIKKQYLNLSKLFNYSKHLSAASNDSKAKWQYYKHTWKQAWHAIALLFSLVEAEIYAKDGIESNLLYVIEKK